MFRKYRNVESKPRNLFPMFCFDCTQEPNLKRDWSYKEKMSELKSLFEDGGNGANVFRNSRGVTTLAQVWVATSGSPLFAVALFNRDAPSGHM